MGWHPGTRILSLGLSPAPLPSEPSPWLGDSVPLTFNCFLIWEEVWFQRMTEVSSLHLHVGSGDRTQQVTKLAWRAFH